MLPRGIKVRSSCSQPLGKQVQMKIGRTTSSPMRIFSHQTVCINVLSIGICTKRWQFPDIVDSAKRSATDINIQREPYLISRFRWAVRSRFSLTGLSEMLFSENQLYKLSVGMDEAHTSQLCSMQFANVALPFSSVSHHDVWHHLDYPILTQ